MEKTKFEIRCDTFKNHTFDNISEISEMRMTDMMDSSIIPQLVEQISCEVQEKQEGVFLETCFRFDIDPNILINQTREIKRLNRMMEYYIKAADKLGEYKDLEEQGLLLRLPCKMPYVNYDGNKTYPVVFDIGDGELHSRTIVGVSFGDCGNGNVSFDEAVIYYAKNRGASFEVDGSFAASEFGKTVFRTWGEAEEKLKELESE